MGDQMALFDVPERGRPDAGTQTGHVLHYLEEHGSISPREALVEWHVYRLAARIKELRDMGYRIETINEKHEGGTHARYVLLTGGET